jgi:hypothetical protein
MAIIRLAGFGELVLSLADLVGVARSQDLSCGVTGFVSNDATLVLISRTLV